MKKFILSLIVAFASCIAFAQSESHLEFKNIPITGKRATFVQKLKEQGFIKINEFVLQGSFAGYSNCTIILNSTPKTDIVYQVIVSFPSKTTWIDLELQYYELKTAYTEKYSSPFSIEYFNSPYKKGDGYEFFALKNSYARYSSSFTITDKNNSNIMIILFSDSSVKASVTIGYTDAEGKALCKTEEKTIVSSDI